MEIENIIFDFGGVIHNIRYENIADMFRSYGIHNFEELYSKASQADFIDAFEVGNISVELFRNHIRELSPITLTDEQIDKAWNAILIDVPKERIELLGMLKMRYKLYLLSNTNELNYNSFHESLQKQFGFDIFTCLFNKSYFSHQMHLRKPNAESFRYIIENEQINVENTLFIDDSIQHVEGARKIGLKSLHLCDNMYITDLFKCSMQIKEDIIEKIK